MKRYLIYKAWKHIFISEIRVVDLSKGGIRSQFAELDIQGAKTPGLSRRSLL
jgi:hypothetical protein